MKVAMGADHGGFALKEDLKKFLFEEGHQVVDFGCYNTEAVDYPDFAQAIGEAIQQGRAERGILMCGSGVGASVAANKMLGVRAGLCHDTYSAHQGVEHDNMNVLCLGARVIGPELMADLVRAYLGAQFTGEPRHMRRLAKVDAIEHSQLQAHSQE